MVARTNAFRWGVGGVGAVSFRGWLRGPMLSWVRWGGGEVGGERVTRAYTVEVQTASVFYAQSLILLLFEP